MEKENLQHLLGEWLSWDSHNPVSPILSRTRAQKLISTVRLGEFVQLRRPSVRASLQDKIIHTDQLTTLLIACQIFKLNKQANKKPSHIDLLTECLPRKREALGWISIQHLIELAVVVQACKPRTQKVKAA